MDSAAAREQLHHHMGELGVKILLGDKNSTRRPVSNLSLPTERRDWSRETI